MDVGGNLYRVKCPELCFSFCPTSSLIALKQSLLPACVTRFFFLTSLVLIPRKHLFQEVIICSLLRLHECKGGRCTQEREDSHLYEFCTRPYASSEAGISYRCSPYNRPGWGRRGKGVSWVQESSFCQHSPSQPGSLGKTAVPQPSLAV